MVLAEVKDDMELRDFFEVDAKHIVLATLYALANEKKYKMEYC